MRAEGLLPTYSKGFGNLRILECPARRQRDLSSAGEACFARLQKIKHGPDPAHAIHPWHVDELDAVLGAPNPRMGKGLPVSVGRWAVSAACQAVLVLGLRP